MTTRCLLALLALAAPVLARAGEAEPPEPPYVGEITGERIYIRAGDGINYTVLTVASQGQRVRVRARRFSWLAIDVPRNCTVWVHKSMLIVAADGKTAALAKDRVNVRARPDLKGDILGQLPKGAQVQVVDEDGEWAGIAPPSQARAWVHTKYVRKVAGDAAAIEPKPGTAAPAEGGMGRTAALGHLRKAKAAYAAVLEKKPDQRDFDPVLGVYQKVAAECRDQAVARRAEQARQRLLKIIDLHRTLQSVREPLKQFERKYEKLEKEYEQRAKPPED